MAAVCMTKSRSTRIAERKEGAPARTVIATVLVSSGIRTAGALG
jgi:hypothetical protein